MKPIHYIAITIVFVFVWSAVYYSYSDDVQSVSAPTSTTGYEAKIDNHLSVMKRMMMSDYEMAVEQAEVEKRLADINANRDMTKSAMKSEQQSFNTITKVQYYSGTNSFQ